RFILIDMDNTIVDWDEEFLRRFNESFADLASNLAIEELVRNRKHFEIEDNFPEYVRPAVLQVIAQPGFYRSLRPLPDAIEALQEMLAEGFDVRLVTAPHPCCPGVCCRDKFAWLKEYLGDEWLHRMILTRDKTLILGDVLIDDKPKITGCCIPIWKHIIFERAYNVDVQDRTRIRAWKEWKKILREENETLRW
ncbi:hypothetical protein GUITHDRAFT_81813, partial [Guillardia theta CCMP2712]